MGLIINTEDYDRFKNLVSKLAGNPPDIIIALDEKYDFIVYAVSDRCTVMMRLTEKPASFDGDFPGVVPVDSVGVQ